MHTRCCQKKQLPDQLTEDTTCQPIDPGNPAGTNLRQTRAKQTNEVCTCLQRRLDPRGQVFEQESRAGVLRPLWL